MSSRKLSLVIEPLTSEHLAAFQVRDDIADEFFRIKQWFGTDEKDKYKCYAALDGDVVLAIGGITEVEKNYHSTWMTVSKNFNKENSQTVFAACRNVLKEYGSGWFVSVINNKLSRIVAMAMGMKKIADGHDPYFELWGVRHV